jgi:outer membrane lipoprotein-sorting protein
VCVDPAAIDCYIAIFVFKPKHNLSVPVPVWMAFLAAVACFLGGCAANQKPTRRPAGTPAPAQTATKEQLIAAYNEHANAVHSINASVSIKLTAGTAYSGVIKQYHEVNGFLLAQAPANIRVIGQAPIVGTNIFDMVSDGKEFHIFIPSKKQFLVGPADLHRQSAKPIENLRPQHLIEAIFWTPIPSDVPVLFEADDEAEARYYVLTVIEPAADGNESVAGSDSKNWLIARKVWFDRRDLSIARLQVYDPSGVVNADVRYSQWDDFGGTRFARDIALTRPGEDYVLHIGINKLTANQPIPPERFVLQQPPGSELVDLSAQGNDAQSKEPKN